MRRWKLAVAGVAAVLALTPGWRGRLEPVAHESVLAAARLADADGVFGVSRPGERPGERWHAQYVGGGLARLLHRAGMGAALPRLLAPAFAAHLPAGAERADGYFRVRTEVHWPWWRPGGGVVWDDPRREGEGG